MAAIGKLRPGQIERARTLLQNLPEKDDRKTREEAAGILEKDFRKALKQGYTPRELSTMLKAEGIIIPAYLVEKYLKPENEKNQQEAKAKPASKPTPKPASAKAVETPPAFGSFTITPDTPLEDL